MHWTRCILCDDPDPSDPEFFERVMEAVEALDELGLFFDVDADEEHGDGEQLSWLEQDELAELALCKDRQSGICSLSVGAVKVADTRRIVDALGQTLAFETLSGLLERARGPLLREPSILSKIAMIAKRPEPEAVSILVDALDHRFVPVRYHAACAMGITGWTIFASELELRLKGEPDDDVREACRRALLSCSGAR